MDLTKIAEDRIAPFLEDLLYETSSLYEEELLQRSITRPCATPEGIRPLRQKQCFDVVKRYSRVLVVMILPY